MQTKVINPYTALGAKHKESLDYIITNLPVNPAFDDLNNKLAESFFTPDPNDPKPFDVAEEVIKTVLPNVYNGYVNGSRSSVIGNQSSENEAGSGYWRYNENQLRLINQMLNGINTIPVETIGEYLGGMEEEIVAGRDAMHRALTYEEQIPLLIAAQVGKSDHEYWMAQLATPGAWSAYLNENNAINYLHVAGWVSASMQGALLAYGLIKPPQIQLLDAFTATIGSSGLVAGKVIFGWIPG